MKIQDAKICRLRTITQLCRAISSQLRYVSTIEKKFVKQQYLLRMSSQNGELRPTNDWDRLVSLGQPSKFQQVSCLRFVTAAMSLNKGQPNFARCLVICWAGTLCIFLPGLLPPNGILPGAKFTLRLNLPFSYIGSVTAGHSNTGISHTLWYGTTNGITELSLIIFNRWHHLSSYSSHHVGHAKGPHSSFT